MTGARRAVIRTQPNTQEPPVLNEQVVHPSTTVPIPPWPPAPAFDYQSWSIGQTIKVVLSFRQSFGSTSEEREVDWPAAWRLPQQGERIHLAADWGGIVSTLDFDFERSAVVIFLR